MEKQVWRYGGLRRSTFKRPRRRKCPAQKDVCRPSTRQPNTERFIHKKRLGSATKKQLIKEIIEQEGISVSRACKIVTLPRSQFYYTNTKDDSEVIAVLQELAFKHTDFGFRKLYLYIRRSGKLWNHKKVYRVYKELKLHKRRKGKRRIPARVKQPLQQALAVNETWSMDFMSDSMVNGRKFRTLNVIDDATRSVLAIEIDTSLSAARVTRTLERIIEQQGKPRMIRVDNGPEFTSITFSVWAKEKGITVLYIQPGKPMQNGYIERFNRIYREAILDAYIFFELDEVKLLSQEWMEEYNERRPHEALDNLSPAEWKEKLLQAPGFIGGRKPKTLIQTCF